MRAPRSRAENRCSAASDRLRLATAASRVASRMTAAAGAASIDAWPGSRAPAAEAAARMVATGMSTTRHRVGDGSKTNDRTGPRRKGRAAVAVICSSSMSISISPRSGT